MRLPEIQLDDRRFQDLVSEARTRIARSCPEWTEHNVSDPGITLIELFAWMTEMTIYRLNRVPDKLHVALLDLLGHPSGRPRGRHHQPALPAGGRAERADPHPRRRDRGRHAAHRARRVDHLPGRRGLHDPVDDARGLRAAARRADAQERRRGRRRGAPAGLGPARVRHAAAGRRLPLPRLRGPAGPPDHPDRRRRLAGARRGREPGGPAAALGGLPGRQRVGAGARARGPHGRLQLRLGHGGAGAAAALGDRPDRRPAPVLAALPDHGHDRVRPPGRDLLARAGDLLDHGRPDGRAPARHARVADRARDARLLRRHARPDLPAAPPPDPEGRRGRDARGPGPGHGRLGALGVAQRLRRLDRARPPLHRGPRVRRRGARPGDPRDERALDPVRRGPAQGRDPALHPLPPRRRARRQRHRAAR